MIGYNPKTILMKSLKIFCLSLVFLTSFSCDKDDDSAPGLGENEDIQQLVENFVTPHLIATLRQLGFTFRDGNEQPDISGSFAFDVHKLKATNIEDDFTVGTNFFTTTLTFSNLNPGNRTFAFSGTEGNTGSYNGVTDTFYSGTGNNFSAYVKFTVTNGDAIAIALLAVSGTVTENGIENAEDAIIMLDNKGNPDDIFIENGTGRLFVDEDGTASRQ